MTRVLVVGVAPAGGGCGGLPELSHEGEVLLIHARLILSRLGGLARAGGVGVGAASGGGKRVL